MVEGVKRLTVTMLALNTMRCRAGIEARSPKNETRVSSIFTEPPCLSADRDTSFDNDKRGRLVPKGGFEPPQDVHPTRP